MLTNVGQVYPRSLDLDVVSALVQAAAGPADLATTIRLMAGQELVTEGFRPGQVGSSAMPHKMNSRSLRAHQRVRSPSSAATSRWSAALAGDQWNEGDVSCSVVRRVALPDAFFAIDGLFETFLTVLDDFGAYPAVIERELRRYLPFLATTKVLMAAVRHGVGREQAHEAIKEHAVAVALRHARAGRRGQRPGRAPRRRPPPRPRPPTSSAGVLAEPLDFVGTAAAAGRGVRGPGRGARRRRTPRPPAYRPGDIL